jgi:hypothetical protein
MRAKTDKESIRRSRGGTRVQRQALALAPYGEFAELTVERGARLSRSFALPESVYRLTLTFLLARRSVKLRGQWFHRLLTI